MKRRLTLAAAFALVLTAFVMRGPDGGTGRRQVEERR